MSGVPGYLLAQFAVPSGTTLSATNNGGGPTTVNLTAGNYTLSSLVTHLQTILNAQRPGSGGATWTVSVSLSGSSPTGKVTISMSAGTFSITWSTALLGTMLGHSTITTQTSVTGAAAARGVWIPDCPLMLDGDASIKPIVTDLRQTESPTGFVLGLVGNAKCKHKNLRWTHVARERTFDVDSGYSSWERFAKDAQLGQGHSWFSPCSYVSIVDHTGQVVGGSSAVWQLKGVTGVEARKVSEGWTGLWSVEIPEIVSEV